MDKPCRLVNKSHPPVPSSPPKGWMTTRLAFDPPALQAMAQFAGSSRVENCPRLLRRRSRGRRSPFSAAILAEALLAGVKVSNLSEYDGTCDPQEHLDKFYAKIDWYDLSDAAYCKVFHTTLSKRALAWFNQLPAGTISSLEQLTQRFLHHFSMNKRVPKISAFLFTIRQRENEPLTDYMQRFVEAVHKKYIRIEESNASDPSLGVKRKDREEEKEPKKKECKHVPPTGFTHYTTLNASRGEILIVAEQQGLIHQWPRKMKDNPKRVKSEKYCRFHWDRGHTTEEYHHLTNEIEKLIQRGYLKEYINQGPSRQPQDLTSAQTRNTDNLPTAGVIAVISGGPRGGDSANARKALVGATRGNH
ncbi:UNVERIFIED_CONTAM: hypothetical protein Scaly_2814700 [Sesamum calycinum]|uniref:Retrotransposon gag domain-containing protein n=1 Tax=Sesamum calycinum TaxID=2727403 RepID=A0AAW2IT60_9LAMI